MMNLLRSLSIALLALALFILGPLAPSYAHLGGDECTTLGGVIDIPSGECQINSAVLASGTLHGGSFDIGETLRICGPSGACGVPGSGKITVPQGATNSLTINIAGKFIMEDGAKIIGDNGSIPNNQAAIGATITITATGDIVMGGDLGNGGSLISSQQLAGSCNATGRGGNISLITTNGSITADEGSVITSGSAHCSAGDILISSTPAGKIDLDGLVLAQGLRSGSGTGKAGGGKITVIAGCELTISDTGVLSSQGQDTGADLVHLEGCKVVVHGLVESKNVNGGGHEDGVDNVCNVNTTAHPNFPNMGTGAGSVVLFSGCVEIWSGTTIEIDSTAGNNGEVSVDGVVANSSWIDLFANGDITITGDTTGNYAVHGNPTGATNNTAALITIKSKNGDVSASNLAVQANATGGGARGGTIRIEAGGALELNTANISAQGDSIQTGGFGFGGKITTRSFAGTQNWQNGVGNVQPTGQDTIVPTDVIAPDTNHRGIITLVTCEANVPDTTGTTPFPFLGDVNTNPVIQNVGACGGSPDIPVTLPPATCSEQCNGGGVECEKASVKSVLNKDTGRFPGNKGPDLTFRLDLGQDQDGNTSIQQTITNATDKNGDSYIIILVAKDGTGLLGGNTSANIVISKAYDPRFALLACSVTIHAKDASVPAGHITPGASSPALSPENIFVMDLHGADSNLAGWLVEGDGRYMRNVANKDNQTGIWFIGNGNTMHNGNAENNGGVGILVQGDGNTVDSTDANANGSHGIQVVGNDNVLDGVDVGDRGNGNGGDGINVAGDGNNIIEADVFANTGNGIVVVGNGSTIKKNDVGDRGDKGNGLDGINVSGKGNTFTENDVLGNLGNGIWVSGDGNTFSKNVSGEDKKGNGGDGFSVAGSGNSFTENKASANGGDGFDIRGGTSSAVNSLKNNQSNTGSSLSSSENAGAEYRLLNYIKNNGGGNKDDGTTLPNAGKCPAVNAPLTGFPATNATANFSPNPLVCE